MEVNTWVSHLLIKCKECKAIVDTGVSMDFDSFCSSEFENNSIVCHRNVCGRKMFWSKDDVLAISFCKVGL